MYTLYISNGDKMLPITDKEGNKMYFQENQLEEIQDHQQKSYAIGRPMWIIYINKKH